MSSESLLVLSNVCRAYRAGVAGCAAAIDVLRGVSLDLHAGSFIAVEGAAGTGKTTLLLCAAGMLRPDSGSVQWPALASRTTQAPRDVRYVGDRAPTYGFLTVRESLAYATTLREIDHPRVQPMSADPLDLAALRDVTGTRVALLTRSERARFLVALALIAAPRVLVVDDLTDGDAVAGAALSVTLSRVAGCGVAVLWAARNTCAVPATEAYELVRGRLRARVPAARLSSEVPVPVIEPVVHTTPSVQRVAEP